MPTAADIKTNITNTITNETAENGIEPPELGGILSDMVDLTETKVPQTTTVNGHALSANVTVTKDDLGLDALYMPVNATLQTVTTNGATITNSITHQKAAVATSTTTDSVSIENTTAAANGAQQYSPSLKFRGRGWNTGSGSSSTHDWRIMVIPTQGTSSTSQMNITQSIDGGTNNTVLAIKRDAFGATQLVFPTGGVIQDPGVGSILMAVGSSGTITLRGLATVFGTNTGTVHSQFNSTTNNLTIGGTTDAGYKCDVIGSFRAQSIACTGDAGIVGKLFVTTGTNKTVGTATLVAGTVTVNNTAITANSLVFYARQASGGTLGNLSVTKVAGTSFTITSSSNTETSTVAWWIVDTQ